MTTLRQKTKVGVDGSLMNQLMGNNSTLPKVGEGATIMYYSDRDRVPSDMGIRLWYKMPHQ
jgi:hypothetical protein